MPIDKLPGQIISLRFRINHEFLNRLERVVFDKKIQSQITYYCKDKRLNLEFWNKTVARELLFLYQWAKSRFILEKRYVPKKNCENNLRVLSLMPSHGFFHTL